MKNQFDVVIVGGGFYGCMLALFLKSKACSVAIIEKEKDLLMRASYNNQARVHNGYHYPRSYLTALRSHLNYGRFLKDFKKTVATNFTKIYCIAAGLSKTTSMQFVKFCQKIGAPIKEAPLPIKKLFNPTLMDGIFEAEEFVFDAKELRKILKNKLKKAGVKVFLNKEVIGVENDEQKNILLFLKNDKVLRSKVAFNCTYSQINQLLKKSNLPLLPFKHEWTEMPLLQVPPQLKNLAITILDGPFFSLMPFPPKKLHTLHHVRYTPHIAWTDGGKMPKLSRKSRFDYMIRDAKRFIPALAQSQHRDSIFEVKTVLEEAETSDKRPILFKKHHGLQNFHVIMGGKIDNIYDCLYEVSQTKF